jgi:hypothetical protein
MLSEQAFAQSHSSFDYLRTVGLKSTDTFDLETRTEASLLANYVNPGTALGWVVEGAIREDDFKTALAGCDSPANPPSAIDRMRHHFLDVQRGGVGLHVAVPPISGLPAPQWALGEQGRGSGPDENQFALPDARLYQLRSLVEPDRQARERNTALLFRTLGHLLHLLEDMAQPQHTRIDFHPGCENALSGRVIPERSWYEAYVEKRATGTVFRGRPTAPLQIVPVPAPRMPTFESFFTTREQTGLAQTGLADFSSRNFFSAGTNLGGLVHPCADLVEPLCTADAYTARDVPHVVVTARGDVIQAPVRLLLSTMLDPVSGAPIPDVAVSSRSLWDHHLEARGQHPVFSLNVLNYDSISGVLLPRAVGYAAGLLDHFFRGRIDASVQPAGEEDPTVLRLVARNTSDEAASGTLVLLAENATTRVRSGVLAPDGSPALLGEVTTGLVPPGSLFPEVRFRPPFAAERYVVAYHGNLGAEHIDAPAGSLGAVIGQVLGGPQAEAIVPDASATLLRAVTGTFRLPPDAAALQPVQWSDVDNHFVGMTGEPLVTGRPGPDEIRLFQLERPVGSVDVPLIAGADPPIVAATLVKTVPFPYGLALPTVVDYTERIRVQEPLVTYGRTVTQEWDATHEVYRTASEQIGPPSLEVPVDETVTFAERFPVILDREHLFAATAATPRPYFWRVLEVGQDARERLLAVVEVEFTRPTHAEQSVTLRARSSDCTGFEPRGAFPASGFFQAGGLIALVDVERAEVIGGTAAPLFSPSSLELAQVVPLLQERRIVTQAGGPTPGTATSCADVAFLGEDGLPTEVAGAITLPPAGVAALAAPGLYRSDIEAVAGTAVSPVASTNEFQLIYARTADNVNRAVTVTSQSSGLTGHLTLVREGLRIRPGSRTSTEILLRFDRPEGTGEPGSLLVRWSPDAPSDTRLAWAGQLDPGRYQLKGATPEGALLVAGDRFGDDPRTVLVDFNANTQTSFAGDLSGQFVLLSGAALYNVGSTHVHTRDTLAETALPLALAPGPAALPPFGDYHLIVQDGP